MNIVLMTGRSPQLAQKEIEAAATILPFQWLLSILQPGVVILKPTDAETGKGIEEKSLWSPEYKNLLDSLRNLQDRLGGTLKIGILFDSFEKSELADEITRLIGRQVTGRTIFGISVYGNGVDPFKLGLLVKKDLKKQEIASRLVPGTEGTVLSTAQLTGNKLGSSQNHLEVLVIKDGSKWQLGLMIASQDIESYRKRDFSIPFPDPVSGMLSPKLAQTMINLAVGSKNITVYDPFCGNGRIVEEARLSGLVSYGSDLRQQQVDASIKNLEWIAEEYGLILEKPSEELVWLQDATKDTAPTKLNRSISSQPFVIVTEPYLGKPLRQPLKKEEENVWLQELQTLYLGFFKVWAESSHKPERFIVVFPKAQCMNFDKELSLYNSLVDRLKKLGYSTEQVSEYGRPDALIKREIIQLRIF